MASLKAKMEAFGPQTPLYWAAGYGHGQNTGDMPWET
jgi:hypothetical protein